MLEKQVMDWNLDRRKLLAGFGAATVAGLCTRRWLFHHPALKDRRPPVSKLAVLRADSYSERLFEVVMTGLRLFGLNMMGKSVLLKPNMVEVVPGREVTTHPLLVVSAAECFLRLGARRVLVGEGPGHERDTGRVLEVSGMRATLKEARLAFVDLNRDEVVRVGLSTNLTGLGHLWLPKTVVEADLIVSMPKVKTHHWAGVSLGMKNMFGIVPGMKYGWPKNLLHWKGIHESILDICYTVPIGLVIADGVLAMEGNGPLHGDTRRLGVIVIGDDPVASDATIVRLMGLVPERIRHLLWAGQFLGNLDDSKIRHMGEALKPPASPFRIARSPFTLGHPVC
jgi:uncharacterized protein (DUF362 family)